jgi:phospholipid transport system substrate-binding protein
MKNKKNNALRLTVALALSLLLSPFASAESPMSEMQDTIDKIVATVENNSGDAAKEIRRSKLREIIDPKFDFAEMARRSLGVYWNEITSEERAEFTKIFSNLLARTYLSKIETVKPGMVKVLSEDIKEKAAIVKTTVTSKGDTFPIDYKLQEHDEGSWRVYDVIIENVGLVATYRNEFTGIIRKEKFAGLMARLRQKSD